MNRPSGPRRNRRLAFFSPLPPASTGVADYGAALAAELARSAPVDLFAAGPADLLPGNMTVRPLGEFAARRDEYPARLYHLGNSAHYEGIWNTLACSPGVVVLHDGTLHHFWVDRTLHRGDTAGYVREMTYAHGAEGYAAAQAVSGGAFLYPFYRFPLLARAVDAATTVIVHSATIARAVRLLRPEARVVQIDHFAFPAPPPRRPAIELRAAVDLRPEAFHVAAFGPPAHAKRPGVTLRAFAAFAAGEPDAVFTWVGAPRDSYELIRLARELGVERRVRLTGWVEPATLYDYMHTTDAAINLRFPTTGEASGMAMRLLAAGVPTVVTKAGWFDELPAGALAAIPPGEGEVEAIVGRLRAWARDAALRAGVSAAARAYAGSHPVARAAQAYARVLGLAEGE